MGNCACNNYYHNSPSQKCININELDSISPINNSLSISFIDCKLRNRDSFQLSSFGKSTENYSKDFSFEINMFKEINFVRTNPKDYALKLKDIIKNIIYEGNNEYLNAYRYGFNKKILLKNGSKIFYDTIDYLNNLKPLHELKLCEEIKVQIDNKFLENEELIINDKNIQNILVEQRLKVLMNYKKCAFNIDYLNNPVLSIAFQITDEMFNQERRNVILNKNFRNFAVNSIKDSENSFMSILSFS
jgi:hypothetical protein